MTARSPSQSTPVLWRWVIHHLRGGRARRDDTASATMVSYVVGACVFVVGSTFLFDFALQPPGVAGLDTAHSTSVGNSALDVLLGSPGYPADWNASEDASSETRLLRLGLIETGATARIDPDKFARLACGSYAVYNRTDTCVDYVEARRALGLDDHDVHIRSFPSVPLSTTGNYGVVGMSDFAIAYVGDYASGLPSEAAGVEMGFIDELDVDYTNTTRFTSAQTGDAYPDDSTILRNVLVPLLGSGVPQAVINQGSANGYDFVRVGGSELKDILTHEIGLTTGLALYKDGTFGYTKNREIRATVGTANLSGLATASVTWKEHVDTGPTRDDGDYGFLEMSPDGGATWYAITNNAAGRSQDSPLVPHAPEGMWKSRTATITGSNCPGCLGATEVMIAFHWTADGDNKQGTGWIIDDVAITLAGFKKTFEEPAYDMLVIGSNVDQNALTPTEVKNGIRDFVELYGGRLVVLGGDQNVQWLQPLFHVGIRDTSQGVGTPDTTHPLLTVPNELDHSSFDNGDKEWDFSGSGNDADLFHRVVGSSSGYSLAVSVPGAFGDGGEGGSILLTTYLPHKMSTTQGLGFIANVLTYGKYHSIYMDVGPTVPDGVSVAAVARTATMNSLKTGTGGYVDITFVMYVWPGNVTSAQQMASGLVVTPLAPSSVGAVASPNQVELTWSAPTDGPGGVTSYNIYRGTAPGQTTFIQSVTAGTSPMTFTDNGRTNGVTYYYNVTATNSYGQGYSSSTVNSTPATTPSAPLATTVVGGNGVMVVNWIQPSDGGGSAITNYTLWMARDDGAGGYTNEETVDNGLSTTFTKSSLPAHETLYVKVRATNAIGDGPWSSTVSNSTTGLPPSPTGLTAAGSVGYIRLTWAPLDPSVSATGYKLLRGPAADSLSEYVTLASANTTFDDHGVTGGTVYYYAVLATNANGDGSYSGAIPASAITVPGSAAVAAATHAGQAGAIDLTITDPVNLGGAPSVSWYHVYRAEGVGGSLSLVDNITADAGGVTSHTDTGLTDATLYRYAVSAVTDGGVGALSSESSAISSTLPDAPVLVVTGALNAISLEWTNVSAPTGFKIYRGPAPEDLALLAQTGTNLSFSDATAVAGTSYYYAVSATNVNGEGDMSPPAAGIAMAAPAAPTVVALTGSGGSGRIDLQITAPIATGGASIQEYRVYRSTTSSGPWNDPQTVAYTGSPQTHTVSGLTGGSTHYFYVTAVNTAGGVSGPSSTVFAVASIL